MKIGVLILNFDGVRWLAPLYASLAAQVGVDIKVFLVDNGSSDRSVVITQESFPGVTIIQMSKNLGYSMAYNAATPVAFANGCDWVIWANNDIKLDSHCINEMKRVSTMDERIGIIGPTYHEWSSDEPNYYMRGVHPSAIQYMMQRDCPPIDVDWVEGSFLMLRRECFESIGPLDPIYLFYWEEVDYCRRARFQDWRVVLAPAAIAKHYAGGTSNNSSKRDSFERLKAHNEYLFCLTDPTKNWSRNCLHAFHLFLVNMKRSIRRSAQVQLEIVVAASVIKRLGEIKNKWKRDFNRVKPSPFLEKEARIRCVILPPADQTK